LSVLSATAGLLLLGAGSAQAVDITTNAECCTFAAGPFVQGQGETAGFSNLDQGGATSFHNVTATKTGPDGEPLFYSETVAGGDTSPVEGTKYLPAGAYPFVCTLHSGMNGRLEVSPIGSPVARPGVKAAIPAQRLARVRKTGKLKIRLSPLAPSTGLTIEVNAGGRLAGVTEDVNLAGQAKTVTIKFFKRARKAIAKGKKVKFAATVQVPWGKTARVSRALR